jgi:N-methylhydantoinase B
MDYSQRIVAALIRRFPDGEYRAEDVMEDDGMGHGPFAIRLRLGKTRGRLTFDFRACDDQAAGGINANRSIVMAACVYVVRCLCPDRLPTNEGLFRQVRVLTRPGSIVEPIRPAPVAGGNVETSQRLVDVGLQAIAQALPDVVPAGSAGTMTNVSMGSGAFAFYETLPGGAGADATGDGTSAVQTHMTNTRNTPVEEMERRYPVRVRALTVRRRSGGRGAHRGGDGIRKEFEVLAPVTLSLFADRQASGPRGLLGGADGRPGRLTLIRAGRSRRLAGKGSHDLLAGDVLRLETPGGGGWGTPC